MRRLKKDEKKTTPIPLLHKNYKDAIHKPDWLHKYKVAAKEPCKFCGAKPEDIVVYDMPLKGGKRIKVWRCTVCDNLVHAGEPRLNPKGT